MPPGTAVDGDTVAERRPTELSADPEVRERLLRRGEETSMSEPKPPQDDGVSAKRSTGQPSQPPTRVLQMTRRLSTSGVSPAPSTLPRSGRERERLSQRRAVTGSAFLLHDAGRVKPPPLRRPASAADADREATQRDVRPTSAVSTPALAAAVSTPTLAAVSDSATALRSGGAARTTSRAESLPRRQSRVSIMAEEEKRKRELGWNSPQNISKSLSRLPRSTPTTRKSSAPVVGRLTRPPPLRKARSFGAVQPAIEEIPEGAKADRRASGRFSSACGRPHAPGSKAQYGIRKVASSGVSVKGAAAESQTKTTTTPNVTGKTSVSSKNVITRVTSPGARVKSPESRVTSPDSRVTSPDSRVTSPDSRVTSPGSRMTSPISRNVSAVTRSLPASYRRRSRSSPVSEPDAACRRSSQPKFSDPSQFRPPSSLAKLSVTARTPAPSFSRASIPKETGAAAAAGRQRQRKQTAECTRTAAHHEDAETEHPTSLNDSGVMAAPEVKKEEVAIQDETMRGKDLNETTVKKVEFMSSTANLDKVQEDLAQKETVNKSECVSSSVIQEKLPLNTDMPPSSSTLPSPDSHNLSHATSASEETGYVSSASHSPPSRSASASRVSGVTSAELVLRYGAESVSATKQLAGEDTSSDLKQEQMETSRDGVSLASIVRGQPPPAEDKETRESRATKVNGVTERHYHDSFGVDRRGRTPQKSSHGPPRAGASSATLDRFRRWPLTPDRYGGSLDRRSSASRLSSDAAELAYLRGTLLPTDVCGGGEESLDRYLAGVARLLRLSRRSAGFQQLKPHYLALQRATEAGAPAARRLQAAEGHVGALLEQLERQQEQQELSGAGGRRSGRWQGDVGLRFRGRSVEDLKRMFAGQTQSASRSDVRSQSVSQSQSRCGSTASSLTQSQVGRLRRQLQQLHSGDSPRRDVTSPKRDVTSSASTRSGFSVDVTDLNGLNNVLPVRPPPPPPPARSHTSYSVAPRSTTLPSVSSSGSSQPPTSEDRLRLVERSECLRRLREERVGRPVASAAPPVPAMTSVTTCSQTSAPNDAGLSPHLPNPVQKPPRVRDIPDDGFRSLPSGSRLRRQRAMASAQYVPQRTVSEQLAGGAAEGGAGDDAGEVGGGREGPSGVAVRPIPVEARREARETSHRASAPPSLSWEVSDARRRPLPTPRSVEDAESEAQVECTHRPEPETPRHRRPSVRKLLLSGFSSLRRKWRSRSGSRKRKPDPRVVVKLAENGGAERGDGSGDSQPPAVETKAKTVDAATSTAVDTNVKRTVGSPHRVRTVGHIYTAPRAPDGQPGRPGLPKPRRPPPEVSLIGQMFTSSPELGDVEGYSRVWRASGLRDEFRPVSNFSAPTDGSAAGSSVVASTPVPPSESSDFSAVWRGPAEMDWSIHRPVGRYVPAGSGGGGYRSLPRPRARRHPAPPATGSLPRPVPRKTPCPCCTRPGSREQPARPERRGGDSSEGGE